MAARKPVLLILALVIAGGTGLIARSMMTPPPAGEGTTAPAPPVATTEVLVAGRDLPAGTLLKEADLKWQVWPEEGATEGFAIKGKNPTSDFVGAVVRQGLRTGEPILSGRVMRNREQGFMAAVLTPGMRAVSISITPVGGVAGFVFPGDHVDVIVTHQVARKTDPEAGGGRKVSETVLRDVRVLALDQKTSDQATEPKIAQTATLEVTPQQAETVALVAELGTLSLALRSLAAPEPGAAALAPPALSENDITWDSDVSRVLPKPGNRAGAVQHIQIMRGKETSETVFDLRP